MKHLFTIIIAAIVFVSAISAQSKPTKAPNFKLKTYDGKVISLDKFKGKVVLVNFWATWCPPCRAEIPDFLKVYKKYKSKGFEIVGIALDETGWSDVKPFMENMKINYPIVLGDQQTVMLYGGIEAIPTTFIVDKKGNIIDRHIGMLPQTILEEKLKKLF